MRHFLRSLSPQSLLCRSTADVGVARSRRKCREGGICSEAVSRGRKIMIHSGQIPTLFLADKILEVSGSLSRNSEKREIHEGNVVLSMRYTEGKV